jgi:DNA-binding transcriptional regulator YiaG
MRPWSCQLDGQPIPTEAAVALGLYNYGHFTSMLVSEQRVKGLELHLNRLAHDCQALFATALDVMAVRQHARTALAELAQPAVARVTIFDPGIELGTPSKPAEPRVLATSRPASPTPPPPLRLRSVRYERELATVKHCGLFGTLHHRRQAQLAGYDDALFIDASGHISEGATWNVAFYDGSEVIWPKADCLPGTAMQLVRGLSWTARHPVRCFAPRHRSRSSHASSFRDQRCRRCPAHPVNRRRTTTWQPGTCFPATRRLRGHSRHTALRNWAATTTVTIQSWTGREARALRQATRISVRHFAAHLGISERAVSKWEAGGAAVTPRPDSQAVLDTVLRRASAEVQARFAAGLIRRCG